jgi:hypothetical protein
VAALQVEAGVAGGGEHVVAQAGVVAAQVDPAPGQVEERVLQGIGGVVLVAEHAHAVGVHPVAVLLEQAGEGVVVQRLSFRAVGEHDGNAHLWAPPGHEGRPLIFDPRDPRAPWGEA